MRPAHPLRDRALEMIEEEGLNCAEVQRALGIKSIDLVQKWKQRADLSRPPMTTEQRARACDLMRAKVPAAWVARLFDRDPRTLQYLAEREEIALS